MARVKIWGAAPSRGRNMVFRKSRFEWVWFHIEISVISGPKFTGLVSPNAGGIAVDKVFIWFWISSSVPKTFAAELWSRPKSSQILHVLAPKIFRGGPSEILDRHYKTGPSTDHHAKFYAGRPTHLGDLALKRTSAASLSLPGELTSVVRYLETLVSAGCCNERSYTAMTVSRRPRHWLTTISASTGIDRNVSSTPLRNADIEATSPILWCSFTNT